LCLRPPWSDQPAAVDGFEDFIATAGEQRCAGVVAELLGIVAVAGVAQERGAIGTGDDGFEMKADPSG
jgi:hypothetical protein